MWIGSHTFAADSVILLPIRCGLSHRRQGALLFYGGPQNRDSTPPSLMAETLTGLICTLIYTQLNHASSQTNGVSERFISSS